MAECLCKGQHLIQLFMNIKDIQILRYSTFTSFVEASYEPMSFDTIASLTEKWAKINPEQKHKIVKWAEFYRLMTPNLFDELWIFQFFWNTSQVKIFGSSFCTKIIHVSSE